jgi:ribosomal protein S27AE
MVIPWSCGDCVHTTTAPCGDLPGATTEVTVGSGDRQVTVETPVCPECGSLNWHSKPTRDAFFRSR